MANSWPPSHEIGRGNQYQWQKPKQMQAEHTATYGKGYR